MKTFSFIILLLAIIFLCIIMNSPEFFDTAGALMQLDARDQQDTYEIGGLRRYFYNQYPFYYSPYYS